MTSPNERRPAWARRGTDVSGMSISDALEHARIDFEVKATPAFARIPEPRELIFNTETQEPEYTTAWHFKELRGKQHTYRTDTLEPLGEVGNRYHVVNTRDCIDMIEEICGGGWTPEFAGALNGGRSVFMVGKLPFHSSEEIDPYLAFVNSFDGTTGVRLANTPIRPSCTNAIRYTFRSAKSSVNLRHTERIGTRIEMIRETLNLSRVYYERLEEEAHRLIQVELDDARLKKSLELMYEFKATGDYDKDADRWNKVDSMRGGFVSHLMTTPTIKDDHRLTAWGVFNAATELEQWFGRNTGSDRQAESLLASHTGIVPTVQKSDRLLKLVSSW